MSPSQEEAEWKEEADSMLEETVPQCMEMDMGMDEGPVHVVESTAIKTTASCSCPTAVVAEATAEDSSTRSRKGSRRDSLPFPLPPTVVSSGKSEAEAVSLGEEQGERGSLAQVDYYKRVDDKISLDQTTTLSHEETPAWSAGDTLVEDDAEMGTGIDTKDVPRGDEESFAVDATPTAAPSEVLSATAAGDVNGNADGDGDGHDGDNVYSAAGPTDEMLREAIREAVTAAANSDTITPKHIRLTMEERFSCNLNGRKAFMKDMIIQALESCAAQEFDGRSSGAQDSGHQDLGDDTIAAATPSFSENINSDEETSERALGESPSSPSLPVSLNTEVDSNDAANLPVLPGLEDTEDKSSASSSSEAEDRGDTSPPPSSMMPRPQQRATSARRALAQAKLRRTVRGARTAGTSTLSANSSLSDSDTDPAAADGSGGSAVKLSRRKKHNKKKKMEDDSEGGNVSDEHNEVSSMSGRDGSSDFSSSGESGKHRGKAKKKAIAAAKHGPKGKGKGKGKGKVTKGVSGVDEGQGLSGLVDSDEEGAKGLGAAADRAAQAVAKAVIQEELDDVNEEKVKERKLLMEERQRQLDSLRVMDAAQLKEVTRAQQGTLLAKIKERQSRVHAALAVSAKEELKRLKAEARKAAGMTEDVQSLRDSEDNDSDEQEGQREPGAAATVRGSNGSGALDGEEDVKGIVAREEEAVATIAAKLAATRAAAKVEGGAEEGESALSEEERDVEEAQRRDDHDSADEWEVTLAAKGSKKQEEVDDDSEEPSESESDEELEVLPAAGMPNLLGLKQWQPAPIIDGGGNTASGTPPITNSKNDRKNHGGGSDAATRALAALPKGMRFSAPKAADKSRAAQRRQLAASARTVANDRWAAQLGYQDGEEHIRDLKYMELKRRQQAQHERGRKEKENAAMAARLLEYAKHADADEEELFGEEAEMADGKTATATTSDKEEGSRNTLSTSASAFSSGDAGDPEATNDETAATSNPECSASLAEGPQECGPGDPTAPSSPLTVGEEDEGDASSFTPTGEGATDAEPAASTAQALEAGEAKQEKKEGGDGAENRSNCGSEDESTTPGEQSKGTESSAEDQLKGGSTASPAAATAAVSSASAALSAATMKAPTPGRKPPARPARPAMVRTYGRKVRDADGNPMAKPADAGLTGPSTVEGVRPLSADSQDLWLEEPDSAPPAAPLEELESSAHVGSGDERGGGGNGVEDSCGMTLGLDDDDDEDETTQPRMDSSSKKSISTEYATAVVGAPSSAEADGSSQTGADVAKDDTAAVHSGIPAVPADDRPVESGMKRKLVEDDAESIPTSAGEVERGNKNQPTELATDATESAEELAAPSSFIKLKIAADGSLAPAPVQRCLGAFFAKDDATAASGSSKHPVDSVTRAPLAKKKCITAFFGPGNAASTSDVATAAPTATAVDGEAGVAGATMVLDTDGKENVSEGAVGVAAAAAAATSDVHAKVQNSAVTEEEIDGLVVAAAENNATKKTKGEEGYNQSAVVEEKNDKEEEEEEEEEPKEPKDRSAKFRAILEAERLQVRHAKKLRKSGMMDEEAEEEEEEEAVRGLGDFGFGVPVSGSGTSATGTRVGKDDDEEEVDDEIREEDLEGIVDTFSDDEGDKVAQDTFLNDEAAAGDRQALKDMVRRVREGFGDERSGRSRGSAARGNLRLDELTAADRSSRKEARRLGLLNSDEEWSDDEKGKGEDDDLEELDEQQLGELLAKEQRARHMGLSQTAQEYLESSDSEGEDGGEGRVDGAHGAGAEEDAERREEERIQKLWVKRAKRRRVLAEVEQSGAGGDSQGPEFLMKEDEDSQAILSLLQCTNSRMGLGLNSNSTKSMEGSVVASTTTDSAGAGAGKKRRGAHDEYSGELDAREVANGFGMGMSSKSLKRAKSDGSNPKDVDPAEARARMDRAFTMPQFVTSVKGFGGSGRAKQAQRKGSFLSRTGSLQARSGSLASGKTTVSASKFVFMSSSSSSSHSNMGGEESATRTGFEDSVSCVVGGGGGTGTGRPHFSTSGMNAGCSGSGKSKAGAFSGIGGVRKKNPKEREGVAAGAGIGSRLWKGLRAESKSKAKR